MFRFSLRKMVKNRWLTLSLLVGYIIAVAILSSMPIYSHAILSRMLLKDLEQVQLTSGIYPGRILSEANINSVSNDPKTRTETLNKYDRIYHGDFLPQLGLTVQEDIRYTSITTLRIARAGMDKEDLRKQSADGNLGACTGLFDHIQLVEGHLPSAQPDSSGAIEAIINERAAQSLNCALGGSYDLYSYTYSYSLNSNDSPYTKLASVKIVGVYTPVDPADLYWVMPEVTFAKSLMIDPELFNSLFIDSEAPAFNYVRWAGAVDYTEMTPENAGAIAETAAFYGESKNFAPKARTAFQNILNKYALRRQELASTLWIIQVPILLMLVLYIFMVSRLILDHEKNEIAVLRSRGSSKLQVTGVYFDQAFLLAAIALVAGPFLALFFCQVIGASNGFMEFVNRKALPISMTPDALEYAAITACVLILTMLFAVMFNGETSIVSFKRRKSGKTPSPLWQRLFLDVIALAVSLYGLYNFRNRLAVIKETGATASDVPIDFMMYVSSTLFILGGTLCFLRLFPLVIKLIYRVGRRFWGPVLYLSLLNASRSGGKNQMISLFLIFTLSMGVFNAVTVRTLNQMEEDRIRYTAGADIVLQEEWPSTGGGSSGPVGPDGMPMSSASSENIYYTEPNFSKFQKMSTVSSAARVLTIKDVVLSSNSKRASGITLMGIVPDEFGQTCWFKNSLLPYHLNEYLNLLASDPRAILLSASFMAENEISPGDSLFLSIGDNQNTVQFTVYAGLDYFPSFNPVGDGKKTPLLAVANLIYLQQETKLEPYAIWLKKAPGVTSAELYEELTAIKSNVVALRDTSVQLTQAKNDALTQGINGYFTLSFLVTMLITFVGFFLYWILAIKSRLLQFGILRSMGLSRMAVVLVLLWEQLLVSVMSIGAGFGLGILAASLFAPILECNVNAADQILPFTVVAFPEDFTRMILIVSVMMLLAAGILGRIVFRLHANEALKLGED